MPFRYQPIVAGQVYHIYNRSVARQPIFLNKRDYERALQVIHYYSFIDPPLRYSHYHRLPADQQLVLRAQLVKQSRRVEMYAYCLMPNHFHFLLLSNIEKGISRFVSDFQNSYAKYFNTRNKRSGALFQSMFRTTRIETDEQFLHVSRYIHLNPYTSYVVKEISGLENYQWSSFYDYIGRGGRDMVQKDRLMSEFHTVEKFKDYILDQAGYQRELENIRHLIME